MRNKQGDKQGDHPRGISREINSESPIEFVTVQEQLAREALVSRKDFLLALTAAKKHYVQIIKEAVDAGYEVTYCLPACLPYYLPVCLSVCLPAYRPIYYLPARFFAPSVACACLLVPSSACWLSAWLSMVGGGRCT